MVGKFSEIVTLEMAFQTEGLKPFQTAGKLEQRHGVGRYIKKKQNASGY